MMKRAASLTSRAGHGPRSCARASSSGRAVSRIHGKGSKGRGTAVSTTSVQRRGNAVTVRAREWRKDEALFRMMMNVSVCVSLGWRHVRLQNRRGKRARDTAVLIDDSCLTHLWKLSLNDDGNDDDDDDDAAGARLPGPEFAYGSWSDVDSRQVWRCYAEKEEERASREKREE